MSAPRNQTLAIVQHRPTQFDAPLYLRLRERLDLHVYYTQLSRHDDSPVDREIGRSPSWDNVTSLDAPSWVTCAAGWSVRDLARALRLRRPGLTVIAGYSPHPHAALAGMLKAAGMRVGLRSDNTLVHSRTNGVRGVVKRVVLPPVLRAFDTWHPVGTLAREWMERTAGVSRPVFLFPYSPDVAWLRERAAAARLRRDQLLGELGFSSDDFVVLGAVKWTPREDPLTLVRAFVALARIDPRAKLILAGEGPLRNEIESELGAFAARVSLPGFVAYSRLASLFALANVFVHPAPGEPWGVSVNEAMACGLPVVAASGVGAATDLVVAGETGYRFADRATEQLASILAQMASDRRLTARMGEAASEMADRWSHDLTIREMERALAADGRPTRRRSRD